MNEPDYETLLHGDHFSPRLIFVNQAERIAELEAKRHQWKPKEIGEGESHAFPQNLQGS